jgi:ankyrin repeat protein
MTRSTTGSDAELFDELRRAEVSVAAGVDPFENAGPGKLNLTILAADACRADCPRVLAAFVKKHGVDANFQASDGHTLLGYASVNGSCKCVAVLLDHGAHVNAPCGEGGKFSPLYLAAGHGHTSTCRQLLDAGAAFDVRVGDEKCTPLHISAERGHIGVVALLIQRGADTLATTLDLRTPIFAACQKQHLLVVKALLPHAQPTHRNRYGMSLLHCAVAFGGPAVLEAVLPCYKEIGALDIPTVVAESNPKSVGGRTPFMEACRCAKYAEAKLLLQAGASRHAKDLWGAGPLHYCVAGSSLACLQLVLGAAPSWRYNMEQLNEGTIDGMTPLHLAVLVGNVDMCRLLIAAGSDPSVSTRVGKTCTDLVRQHWPDRAELATVIDADVLQEHVTQFCANCQKKDGKLKACSGCHAVRYCTSACQRAHWRQHKSACVRPADILEVNRAKFHTS